MERELKKVRTKLGAVISAVNPANKEQVEVAIKWPLSAAIAVVHSPTVPINTWPAKVAGLYVVQNKVFPPTIRTIVGEYMTRIRGDVMVAFTQPGVTLTTDFSALYRYADENRLERTYGFYVNDANDLKAPPIAFIFTGSLIEYLFHGIPHTTKFDDTNAWAVEFHKWGNKAMFGGRYSDATHLKLATKPAKKTEVAVQVEKLAEQGSSGLKKIKELFKKL
jgi:hypothetical protein